MRRQSVAYFAVLLIAGPAFAAEPAPPPPPEEHPSRMVEAGKKVEDIVTQPARDVGLSKVNIPPVLVLAREDPYSLKEMRTCVQLASAVKALNEALGPDYAVGIEKKENRAGKIAEAGGRTAVNSLLPFRGLVRELSGAAPAQRRLNDAVDAGIARRGFLRGVHTARGCRTSLN